MITNPQNEKVKELAKLHMRKERKETGKFIIEGVRFVEEALRAGVVPEQIVVSPKLQDTERGQLLLQKCQDQGVPVLEVEQRILAKVADTDNPQGIVAVVRQREWQWPEMLKAGYSQYPEMLKAGHSQYSSSAATPHGTQAVAQESAPFWLVVDGVQDPGNLGTIVRTAHAAGISGLCLTQGTVDVYNSKVLRSTMGSIFYLPVLQGLTAEEILEPVKEQGWQVVVGDIETSREYFDVDYRQPTVMVVGSEAQGPSAGFLAQAAERVKISMPGQAESLNVAVAAGILLFEGVRQRLTPLNPCQY